MFRVEGNLIDHEGNHVIVIKEFANLDDAEKYADEELDGYTIINSEDEDFYVEQEDSETIKEGTLDMMYPNRHDEDFDQDQISGEDFFKE